ncbi:MAG: hypothetical protein HRT90_03590 [Candidatus Margulisbacteria bacterium]|nr:hypothetical protein [Candidatus Margulisiibacteriota bacterium]
MQVTIDIPELDQITDELSLVKDQLNELKESAKSKSWLTYKEVSKRLKMARNKLISLQKAGVLINQNPNGHPRFSEENVEEIVRGKF